MHIDQIHLQRWFGCVIIHHSCEVMPAMNLWVGLWCMRGCVLVCVGIAVFWVCEFTGLEWQTGPLAWSTGTCSAQFYATVHVRS